MNTKLEELSIATIRSLIIDMTNKAKSGHPGMAIGSTPILFTLFTRHFVADPKHPKWINRDRFVLSAGHVSPLLYSMLHLCGYNVSLDDLKKFRQLGSITPGHPEYGVTEGIDATAGPLGQGLAQAVGMAVAERSLSAMYTKGDELCNHYTYVLCGDGCLQEGISQEAISFAGHQKLNKLILFYDCNDVTLDGKLELSNSEDTLLRFKASGWNVIEVKDGNDLSMIDSAIKQAKKSKNAPTLIKVNTIIGFGSINQGTNKVHGAPIGEEDGKNTKVNSYGFDHDDFFVPEEVKQLFADTFIARGEKAYNDYQVNFEKYRKHNPAEAARFLALENGDVSSYIPKEFPDFPMDPISTRVSSNKALNDYFLALPNLIGGAADVASSVQTKIKDVTTFSKENPEGRNINFGIREFAMASISNGVLLHGGLRIFVGSFFAFSDYFKPAIRMAALEKIPNIYLFSHDSIAVGEDGPTHQPIEHLAGLRCIPHLHCIRPCDLKETYGAWRNALLSKDTPTAILLSRQNLPVLPESDPNKVDKGAYLILKNADKPDYLFIATGSEVTLAIDASKKLLEEGIKVNVISMPSMEIFNEQDEEYKSSILSLPREKRISIEMLSSFGWDKYSEHHISVDTFGASAPAKDVIPYFHFTVSEVVDFVKGLNK